MLKNALFVLLMLLFIKANAQRVFTISGVVTDAKDNPIPGATVFLDDSRKATASDSEGKFVLERVQPGNYTLVVKMIGFVILKQDLTLPKDTWFRFKLTEDNTELKTVEISSMSLADRKRHLATFIHSFFGSSAYAQQCEILNTDDIKLRFNKKDNVLTARSDEFLIIENRALGYKMMYLLNDFSFDRPYEYGGIISFSGTTYFEELLGNERQQKQWEQERTNAYFGSLTHFFRSLFTDSLKENGFVPYLIPNPSAFVNRIIKKSQKAYAYLNPVKNFDKYITAVDSNNKRFDLGLIKKTPQSYMCYTHLKPNLRLFYKVA